MGAHDKVSNKIDDVAGKAKEGLGKATDDHSTETEGKLDQAKAGLRTQARRLRTPSSTSSNDPAQRTATGVPDPGGLPRSYLGGPVLARSGALRGFVDAEDKRCEYHLATVRISVGDRSGCRPIRMRLNRSDPCRYQPRSRSLLSRGIGEIQAQLLVTIHRNRFDGLDDLEGETQIQVSRISLRCCHSSRRTWRTAEGRPGRGRS